MNDLISRQAAIDAFYKHPNINWTTLDVLAEINALPSAQPDLSEYSDKLWKKAYERGKAEAQQRWIPCSERLPEFKYETYDDYDDYTFWDTDFVIGATSRGTLSIGQFTRDSDKPNEYHWDACECDAFDLQGCLRIGDHIIAWMPLPEPYAERRTDVDVIT